MITQADVARKARVALILRAVSTADVDLGDAARADRFRLRRYWTESAEGLAKWATKPHPWTALYRHLRKHMPAPLAKRVASQWFHRVFKIWPGERKGRNPAGPG